MNYFKNISTIIALFAISLITAKQTGTKTVTQPITQPQQPSFAKSGIYPEPVEGKGRQPQPKPIQQPVQPSQQQQQQTSQSKVAIRRANMNVSKWGERDLQWMDDVWDSLTSQEKWELYNENQEKMKFLANTFSNPLSLKFKQWLTENKIPFAHVTMQNYTGGTRF